MKIKDFVEQKLKNFKIFIGEELEKTKVEEENKKELIASLELYSKDVTVFMQAMVQMSKYKNNIDLAVSLFLANYKIKIEDIKESIDYDKLKNYLNMFIDVVTENK
jgi:hypothetical protein